MSLVSIAEVRALVSSSLSDADLQVIIDREEAWLAGKIGALTGERTESFIPRITDTSVYLQRRSVVSSVTDEGTAVAAADFIHTPSTGEIRRVVISDLHGHTTVEPYFPPWEGTVAVTHTPSDTADIKRAIIELIRGTAGETGYDSETIGSYSYSRGTSTGRLSRPALVAGILTRRPGYSLRLRNTMEPA